MILTTPPFSIGIMFFIALGLTFFDICEAGKKSYGDFDDVHYVRNYDGDTITFDIPSLHPLIGENISIRVAGIDTPEIRGKCKKEKLLAREAKALVRDKLSKALFIDLKNVSRGKYFRIVADVYVDGKSLSPFLIKQNLAHPYTGKGRKKDWCK